MIKKLNKFTMIAVLGAVALASPMQAEAKFRSKSSFKSSSGNSGYSKEKKKSSIMSFVGGAAVGFAAGAVTHALANGSSVSHSTGQNSSSTGFDSSKDVCGSLPFFKSANFSKELSGYSPAFSCRKGYANVYSKEYQSPLITYHKLEIGKISVDVANRSLFPKFSADSELGSRPHEAYTNAGAVIGMSADRGHMVPAEDADYSIEAMRDTFLTSNVVVQEGPNFNRTVWQELEKQIRDQAKLKRGAIVATVAVGSLGKVKSWGINIPSHMAKVVKFGDGSKKVWIFENKAYDSQESRASIIKSKEFTKGFDAAADYLKLPKTAFSF